MIIDLKVLDNIIYNDNPEYIKISFDEHIKISFDEFFSNWRKYMFFCRKIWRNIKYVFLYE